MDNFFQRDSRIDSDSALRDMEKKLHWCMQMILDGGLANDKFGNGVASPDNTPNIDILEDAGEVREQFTQ
jgi:hypothetical protein